MTLVVPDVAEVVMLDLILAADLTLKLYSNNVTPGETDTISTYTEVAGGGYAAKTLIGGSWTVTSGAPGTGQYSAQDFTFTGATTAPGTIYGYYVINAANVLMWAERFDPAVVPVTPSAGYLLRIIPKIQLS